MNDKNSKQSTKKFMEVELVHDARSCRECTFFWPESGTPQPYGPYPAFDFNEDTPAGNAPPAEHSQYPQPWPWAIKQFIQTRPAVLFIVGEASYSMFKDAFGNLIKADCFDYLQNAVGVSIKIPEDAYEYMAIELQEDSDKTLAVLKSDYQEAFSCLEDKYYDPHAMMGSVLESLYDRGKPSYSTGSGKTFLTRAEQGCHFCGDNGEWSFPGGCPYGKTAEPEDAVIAMVAGKHEDFSYKMSPKDQRQIRKIIYDHFEYIEEQGDEFQRRHQG